MKIERSIVLLLLTCLLAFYCNAQSPEVLTGEKPPRNEPKKKRVENDTRISVVFVATDTCNIKINGKDYGDFTDNKQIKLSPGNYKFLFESLETGKVQKIPFFPLTRDSATSGKYTYLIRFK